MLKNPLPGRMRTTLGAVIATVLIVIGSYGAWAVQPAETAKDASSKRLSETDNTPISYRKLRPPVYPEQAQDSGVEGVLYVRVQVDNKGKVTNAAIEYADPPSVNALAATTLEVVKAWSFNPAKANGKAIPGTALVPIRYDLGGQVSSHPRALPADALDQIIVSGKSAKTIKAQTAAAGGGPSLVASC